MQPKTGGRPANWCLTDANISAATDEHVWAGPSAGVLISPEVERPSRNRICSRSCHLETNLNMQQSLLVTCSFIIYLYVLRGFYKPQYPICKRPLHGSYF